MPRGSYDRSTRFAPALGAIRRALPLDLRFRLGWARRRGRPDFLVMPSRALVREVLSPLFRESVGYVPDLDRPRTFNEKVQWRKLHDRRRVLALAVDKYRVRDYVAARIGGEYLVPLLHVGARPEQIPFGSLSPPYIIKPNNCSGMTTIVRSREELDAAGSVRWLRECLRETYGLELLEWAYGTVDPLALVEPLLLDDEGRLPMDYKFHVFDGRVAYVHVDQDRETGLRSTTHDRDWRPLALRQKGIAPGDALAPPPNAALMIELAERLAAELEYARIDLYNVGGRVYFGELTVYPDSGLRAFDPPEWDLRWGELWTLPSPETCAGP